MKLAVRVLLPLACSIAVAALVANTLPAAATADETQALIAVDKKMQHAFVTRDVAALDSIFTDDYVLVLWNGRERTKQDILTDVRSPDVHWEVNETSGWKVRVHGDLAIVVATLHQKGVDHGQAFDSNVKFSDTYIRENGKWRNVHAHASKAVDVQ